MLILLAIILISSPILFLLFGGKSSQFRKKWKVFKISSITAFNFMFTMKSEERLDAVRKIHNLFPKFLHIDFMNIRVLMVYDPEVAKKVFTSVQAMQRCFSRFVPLDKGLLFSSYADWREPRKHLNLAFNLNVLKGFLPIFSSYSDLTVQELQENAGGEDFDVFPYIVRLIFRTVSATLLNVHRYELRSFEELYSNINKMNDCLFTRMSNPLLHKDFIYKLTPVYQREKSAMEFLMLFGNELIDEARRRHEKSLLDVDENENVVKDEGEANRVKINFIIDQLIYHPEKYSDDEIRDHLLTFMITASDTTLNLVAASLMYMAMNQDVQQKVYDEIEEIYSVDFNIDYERLSELKYLEMVLKETLRLFSPIPLMTREAFADCDVGTGKTCRKGTQIFILNYILHQRKDIWGKQAAKFDPENFSPENSSKRDPYSFVPFGSGQRNCIGNRYTMLAAKVFVAKIIKEFKFTTKLTEGDMKMKLAFTGKLASKYSVSIEKRG